MQSKFIQISHYVWIYFRGLFCQERLWRLMVGRTRATRSTSSYARVVFVQAIKGDGRVCPHITTHPGKLRHSVEEAAGRFRGERSTGTYHIIIYRRRLDVGLLGGGLNPIWILIYRVMYAAKITSGPFSEWCIVQFSKYHTAHCLIYFGDHSV